MLAICIEASHARGMGHLFRALNLIAYLNEKKISYIVLINEDAASLQILEKEAVAFEIVDFADETGNWEPEIIRKYGIKVWLNDKFESSYALCNHIKEAGAALAVIDDRGTGARLSDVHFAGMMFGKSEEEIPGKKVFTGMKYNILNPEIEKYRRVRRDLGKIVVTLGGSDTYGATVQAVRALKKYNYAADIIVGANFKHEKELLEVIDDRYRVFWTVPSLMEAFATYDFAITGGGVTPLEANAAGLPCLIIANEPHEIVTGRHIAKLGGAVFAGYYQEMKEDMFDLSQYDIEQMSKAALTHIQMCGCEMIWQELEKLF